MREFEAISEESQGRPKVVSVGERSELDEVLRHRARRMLVQAVEAEAAACGFAVALRNCHNSKLLAVFRRIVAPEREIGQTKARLAE